jgi:hypothetical protein
MGERRTSGRKVVLAMVGLGLIVGGLVYLGNVPGPSSVPPGQESARARSAEHEPGVRQDSRAGPPLTALGAPAPALASAGRTELLRSPPPRPPLRPIARLASERTLPVDRRDGAPPDAPRQLEVLSYAFETLDDDIRACLDQWTGLDPARTPEVLLGFELDRSGLTRSFVENADDIPFGPRTCLATAVYGLDWSNIVDEPVKVTKRFALGPPDAGR